MGSVEAGQCWTVDILGYIYSLGVYKQCCGIYIQYRGIYTVSVYN